MAFLGECGRGRESVGAAYQNPESSSQLSEVVEVRTSQCVPSCQHCSWTGLLFSQSSCTPGNSRLAGSARALIL